MWQVGQWDQVDWILVSKIENEREFYQWQPIRYELPNRLVSSVNSPVTSDTRLLMLGTILQERSEIYYEYPWWWDCVAFLCCRPSWTFALIILLIDLQCSVSCGIGSRRRAVICSGGRNRCDPKSRPKDISQCSPGACPEWKAGEWSQVGVLYFLRFFSLSHFLHFYSSPKHLPIDFIFIYSKCSVTCGNGSKQRAVECSRSDVTCDPIIKPTSTARCDLGACPKWETGEWSLVSVFRTFYHVLV